ncbi:8-amino-7-oxononanoate synthase [Caballeronia sp. ATUFL_F1_KS39]|uniref:8-amino-7-oxononanoate synthase n=1 Tax=Caballeronia sp. ATUFL_F1_KS39 TaxID=2921766 RepID=UPI002028CFAE|nr:8-amino-7-oxononanoate synthase [Caballeronia sp. ATUFL_F1_KS39]
MEPIRVHYRLKPTIDEQAGTFTVPDIEKLTADHKWVHITLDPTLPKRTYALGEQAEEMVGVKADQEGRSRSKQEVSNEIDALLFELLDGDIDTIHVFRKIKSRLMEEGRVELLGSFTIPLPQSDPQAADAGQSAAPTGAAGAPLPVFTASAAGSGILPPPVPDLDPNSGPVAPNSYVIKNPITLQRTTRPLSGDIALWLMIKLNADMLGWRNYTDRLALLFGPDGMGAPAPTSANDPSFPIFSGAQQLSRRRFLPFTDTEAYRALRVATEAFVVTWGGVVPSSDDFPKIAELLGSDPYALYLASTRLGISIEQPQVNALAKQYFGMSLPPSVPYLQRVVDGLNGTDSQVPALAAQSANAAAPQIVMQPQAPIVPSPVNHCGEGCLWLGHLNQDFSAKLMRPPLIELIWSYWMEEMQLVQTMNAISRRFQNVSGGPRDPLIQLELDAVRPLNNMIWGWVQDEQSRLPIERRAAEYQHEYGFRLFGRAVPTTHAADVRSKFLAAFHTLLNLCVPFFRQADDTTVVPDGFPLLNALREVHLILSEGAHNQFRELPSTSRIEMLMQQWILARPEFREFLPRRAMIAYPEPWMHSVESMRKLQGWGDTNTYQFWQLATTGEQIVSSIRWGNWNSIDDPNNAANWAAFFRPEIQTYIHSYRAVTGVDVSADPVDVQVPGMHLMRRMQEQQRIKAA